MVETPTILVVDDNPDNIKIIALILRSLHYKIVIATSGAQAIEMVEHTHPDLILLDVMMPHLDGFETSRIIKSKPEYENMPIIFITALNDTESLVKGFQAGGVDYITKPFNRDELISRMRTHIDLKQTRDKLESATKHLEQLNTLKDTMFSVIGHDLRSPLSSVKMTLEFLAAMACFDNHKISESIHLMLKTTDEVFNLLENLLAWAKSQSNNIQINKEKLCTADLVNNLYFLNKGTLEQKRIAFHQEIETGHFLNADLNTLKVVLRNLLSNAIKFTPENGTVTIKALYVEGKSRIIVSDTGIGISETDLPKLLNPSQHHTTYGTNNESGSGLGLLLCKDFMEKNGGVISVESKLGKGTNFILDLPMSENL